ncbi:MAG: Unknown protein [uncultured Sulfurovum sp.]|uniref:Uncharacterized protein n=1 Tax=uncultured Sulfurovum sp. TaxID=269237 RepID=A0A6S6S6L8_9BACT|nr:MAG: Unknown protein [uncultured Sulfurovum sp.]
MNRGIDELRKKFEVIYNALNGEYVGYIQMSDKRIQHIYTKSKKLWGLDALYEDSQGNKTDVNYVLEMALFHESTKQSILVRQHNNGWLYKEETINDSMPIESFYTITSDKFKMKMAQVWEPKKNEFCLDWEVMELQCLMFAGFETPKGEKS